MPPIHKIAVAAATMVAAAVAQSSVSVNYNSELQTMDGFGISQAFGRAAEFRDLMTSGARQQSLDYLFSTTTGAGLSIIRNRVGSGGRGDSILPTSPGSPNGTPNYVWDGDDRGQVWLSKEAMKYGVKIIHADAWSAPGFMKTNGNEVNGGYLCGVTGRYCSSGDWRQAYANLLAQYVKFYADEGIPISHIGFLNEPDYVVSYSSMQSDGNQAASFLPTLYDTFQAANLSHVKLVCCDALGWNTQRSFTSQIISAGADRYLDVITAHAYESDATSPMNTNGLPTWITEACDLNSAWCTTWFSNGGLCEGMTWAAKIARGVIDAGLSAYIYWQGAEVNQFQAASYLVASNGNNSIPSGRLWAFAMWSRFIRPEAKRLSTSGGVSSTIWGAFKNTDGTVVVVFTNTGYSSQSARVSFSGFAPTTAEAYLTDNSHSVDSTSVTLSGGAATVSIPGHAVVTIKLTSGDPVTTTTSSSTTSASSSSSSSSSTTSTTSSTSSQPTNTGCSVPRWGQCGGIGYNGCTTCASGTTCQKLNDWYSQCI